MFFRVDRKIPYLKKTSMKRIFTLTAVIATLAMAGCSKENINTDQSDLVGTWVVTGISSSQPYDWNGDGYTETDIFGSYTFCQRDITLTFYEGGTGDTRQGCNAGWQNFYWNLSNNYLSIDLPSDDLNLRLTQFSQSVIRGEDQVYVNGNSFVITYTFSRR
jgi:hypothetical protein